MSTWRFSTFLAYALGLVQSVWNTSMYTRSSSAFNASKDDDADADEDDAMLFVSISRTFTNSGCCGPPLGTGVTSPKALAVIVGIIGGSISPLVMPSLNAYNGGGGYKDDVLICTPSISQTAQNPAREREQ